MTRVVFILAIIFFQFTSLAGNKTWKCIDENGQEQFQIEAIYVSDFHNGLASVYKNTLVNNAWVTGTGYVNTKGEVVIPCIYKNAKDFEANVTWVKKYDEDFWRLIDKSGAEIPANRYDKVQNFYSEFQSISAVYQDGKMGFVNQAGKEIIPCKYIGSSVFTEGLASVCLASSTKGEYGYINETGEVTIPLKFIQAGTSSFEKGLARATVAGKTVLIDKKGATVFKTTKGNIQGHGFGLISVITKPNRKAWGWINFKDEFVIQPIYDYATNFNDDGYAIVEKNGLKGVIDTTGKTILPLKYKTVYCDFTEDGYLLGVLPTKEILSQADTPKDYFDKNLKPIPMDGKRYLMSAKGGSRLIFSTNDKRSGALDRNFKEVIPAKYSKFNSFSEGLAWVVE